MIDLSNVFTTAREAVVRKQQDAQLLAQDVVAICMLMNLLT